VELVRWSLREMCANLDRALPSAAARARAA
jgi:hypothetical protein